MSAPGKLCFIVIQNLLSGPVLSNLFLKVFTVSACTTEEGRLFHNSTTLSEKKELSQVQVG